MGVLSCVTAMGQVQVGEEVMAFRTVREVVLYPRSKTPRVYGRSWVEKELRMSEEEV